MTTKPVSYDGAPTIGIRNRKHERTLRDRDLMLTMADQAKHLHERDLKATPPRLQILALLEEYPGTLWTAEMMFRELGNRERPLSLPTVYRVLDDFSNAQVLIRYPYNGNMSFALNDGRLHNYICCARCGKAALMPMQSADAMREAAAGCGFVLANSGALVVGLCDEHADQGND